MTQASERGAVSQPYGFSLLGSPDYHDGMCKLGAKFGSFAQRRGNTLASCVLVRWSQRQKLSYVN